MLAGDIIFGVFKLLIALMLGESYRLTDFLNGAFLDVWPGLILCIAGVPLVVFILERIGVLKVLRDE